jgi:hypothetical protein
VIYAAFAYDSEGRAFLVVIWERLRQKTMVLLSNSRIVVQRLEHGSSGRVPA